MSQLSHLRFSVKWKRNLCKVTHKKLWDLPWSPEQSWFQDKHPALTLLIALYVFYGTTCVSVRLMWFCYLIVSEGNWYFLYSITTTESPSSVESCSPRFICAVKPLKVSHWCPTTAKKNIHWTVIQMMSFTGGNATNAVTNSNSIVMNWTRLICDTFVILLLSLENLYLRISAACEQYGKTLASSSISRHNSIRRMS